MTSTISLQDAQGHISFLFLQLETTATLPMPPTAAILLKHAKGMQKFLEKSFVKTRSQMENDWFSMWSPHEVAFRSWLLEPASSCDQSVFSSPVFDEMKRKWEEVLRYVSVQWKQFYVSQLVRKDLEPRKAWIIGDEATQKYLHADELDDLHSHLLRAALLYFNIVVKVLSGGSPYGSLRDSREAHVIYNAQDHVQYVGWLCSRAIFCSTTLEKAWLAAQFFYVQMSLHRVVARGLRMYGNCGVADALVERIGRARFAEFNALFFKVKQNLPPHAKGCTLQHAAEQARWYREHFAGVNNSSVLAPKAYICMADVLWGMTAHDEKYSSASFSSAWAKIAAFIPARDFDFSPPIFSLVIWCEPGYAELDKEISYHLKRRPWDTVQMVQRSKAVGRSRPSHTYLRNRSSVMLRCIQHQTMLEVALLKWRLLCISGICADVVLEIVGFVFGRTPCPRNFFKKLKM